MERTDTTQSTEKTGFAGNWFVVIGVAGRFIVRTEKTREEVRELHEAGKLLCVQECFEFSSQLQVGQVPSPHDPRVPMMQIGKMNVAHRLDGTLFPTVADLSLAGALVYCLDGLVETDAVTYKDFIKSAIRMAEGWYEERVRAKSKIELTSALPPTLQGTLFR